MKIKDLIGKTAIIFKPSQKVVMSTPGFSGFTFPDGLLYVATIQKNGPGVYLTFLDLNMKSSFTYVPNEFEIEVVNNEESKELLKIIHTNMLSNLSAHLHHYFAVGSDPEVFAQDETGNLIPAFNFLPNKEKAVTNGIGNNGYWDGFQGEFTTAAGTCLDNHVGSVRSGLQLLYANLIKHNPKAVLSMKTVFDIPKEMLKEGKEEHVQFGCMPSQNIYDLKGAVVDGRQIDFRPAGGHIHLGMGPKDPEQVEQIVKALDAILGVACVSLFATFDDARRRQLYGLPGEYRLPKHGIEYRSISNAWLMHPTITYLVFELARKAAMFGDKGLLRHWKGSSKETIEVMMTSDYKRARLILERNKEFYLKMFTDKLFGNTPKRAEALFGIFTKGAESIITNPQDLVGNWKLSDINRSFAVGNHRLSINIDAIAEGKKAA